VVKNMHLLKIVRFGPDRIYFAGEVGFPKELKTWWMDCNSKRIETAGLTWPRGLDGPFTRYDVKIGFPTRDIESAECGDDVAYKKPRAEAPRLEISIQSENVKRSSSHHSKRPMTPTSCWSPLFQSSRQLRHLFAGDAGIVSGIVVFAILLLRWQSPRAGAGRRPSGQPGLPRGMAGTYEKARTPQARTSSLCETRLRSKRPSRHHCYRDRDAVTEQTGSSDQLNGCSSAWRASESAPGNGHTCGAIGWRSYGVGRGGRRYSTGEFINAQLHCRVESIHAGNGEGRGYVPAVINGE